LNEPNNLIDPITVAEVEVNLAKCKNKSAPGQDGIGYPLIKKLPDNAKK